MSTYFRWIAPGPDLAQARLKVLQVSASPRTAYWIFDMLDQYKPSVGVFTDRVLVGITFTGPGEQMIANSPSGSAFRDRPFRAKRSTRTG